MNKTEILNRVRAALEEIECPVMDLEGGPGITWYIALGEDYEKQYAIGELFFASDVNEDADMNGVDVAQINLVFLRDIDPERVDTLRAYFAKVNRLLTGGRFDAQQEQNCFAEYGHDIILPDTLNDDQAEKAVITAMDLATAYITFAYEGASGLCAGDLTVEQALAMLNQ